MCDPLEQHVHVHVVVVVVVLQTMQPNRSMKHAACSMQHVEHALVPLSNRPCNDNMSVDDVLTSGAVATNALWMLMFLVDVLLPVDK